MSEKREQPKHLTSLSDEELMTLYQSDDFSAFEVLYQRHSGRVHGYLRQKVSPEVASELVQEIFEKLHRSRDRYNALYPFLPWLFTISRNALTDSLKRVENKISRGSSSEPELLESYIGSALEPVAARNVEDLLKILPTTQKQAVELRYLKEWSFEKIAADMKTTEANVRQLVSRAIKKIRSQFSGTGDGDE